MIESEEISPNRLTHHNRNSKTKNLFNFRREVGELIAYFCYLDKLAKDVVYLLLLKATRGLTSALQ